MDACPGSVGFEKMCLGLGLSSSGGVVGCLGDWCGEGGRGSSQWLTGMGPHPSSDLWSSGSKESDSVMRVRASAQVSVSIFPSVHEDAGGLRVVRGVGMGTKVKALRLAG